MADPNAHRRPAWAVTTEPPACSLPSGEPTFSSSIFQRRHILQNLRCDGPVLHPFITTDCAVFEVNAALGELRDIRLVRYQHDGQATVIQLLKHFQNLYRG